eukprot:SAG25_NODE_10198_length_343_cov_0.635246_1_plen_54_part_10
MCITNEEEIYRVESGLFERRAIRRLRSASDFHSVRVIKQAIETWTNRILHIKFA